MKIGIIVHSHTGHTLSVASLLQKQLEINGHDVEIKRVIAFDENPSKANQTTLKEVPPIEGYDVVIFGAPVRGFALSPVMRQYLKQIRTLANIKVGCFVTQSFPYAWMGGKQAISQMKELCLKKLANVQHTGIVNWLRRKKLIPQLLNKFFVN